MKELTEHRARVLTEFFVDVMGWGERGVTILLEQCKQDDARAVCLALTRISLDERMDGPGILPQHGQHWRDTDVAVRSHRVLCAHGRVADTTTSDTKTCSTCNQCNPPPVRTLTREDIWAQYQAAKVIHAPATRQALTGKKHT